MVSIFIAIVGLFFHFGKGNLVALIFASIASLSGFAEAQADYLDDYKTLVVIISIICTIASLIGWWFVAFV